ncbi:MAG: hypothetical protein COA52_14005 [Hyphomicrobiales bacterium]|nr:TRAP transporter substrate-binding protein DctP [Hyphomicrobiales bacterium]PCJ87511.1 MAG: hypothetical protein COA52_14005 [Hyphomicrobiales bacterium]
MTKRNFILGAVFALATTIGISTLPTVSDAQEVNWRGAALQRVDLHWSERWVWLADQLKEKSGGKFSVELSTFPELGLNGGELIRLLNTGLMDMGDVVTGYVSGEVPIFEGAQLPGVYANYNEARAGYAAWEASVVADRGAAVGGRVLTSFSFGSQFLWSTFEMNDLSDLKGKRIRVFAKAQADYLEAFGAIAVNMPLAEVYSALQLGTVDGAVSGAEYARGASLWEVVSHVIDLRLGVGAGFMVVSEKSLAGLDEKQTAVLDSLIPELRDRSWELGKRNTDDGMKVVLEKGIKATVPAKPEWEVDLLKATQDAVLVNWAARAGDGAKEAFNANIAPIVGYEMN